ncbi:ATP-dependent RNA helicase DBP10 [Psilocybe cubensis]|uniref:ATP-dependent RNA helicase DBP10 n=2 Tax=Psilocybe cubensis TaxID=181762 RepID=A0ACB8HD59_PSICU|nr:ATP-dependent RNA helicase DBP10 [Psilocybe cubensis]KAH9485411.1 ATP-dependent RNA helicase DBP10 [Psilocybe cubensis]
MPIPKRKHLEEEGNGYSSSSSSSYSTVGFSVGADVDISSALTGKRPKLTDNTDDDDLSSFLQASIAKRSMKEGTAVMKKSKGKSNLAKGEVGGGSFQSMGLHPSLLRSLTLQGYRTPTPIQRLSIPALLANPPRDLVGMARTGSGKSLAYMIPLVNRLGGRHSTSFGARGLILLPTRELALQVLRVGKELTRGFQTGRGEHAGDKANEDSKKGESLRWGLVVGGENLDEQFEMITSNPDIIIATPGRLLHLIVEMDLDLKAVECVVFDEADRLFEMGFQVALNEILGRLPTTRQTILFSATLPKSLVEFAKAGLQDPKLVRLDSESKISPDLKMAFFSVKQAEKDACLLSLLRDIIKVPFGSTHVKTLDDDPNLTNRKRKHAEQFTSPHQTLIFTATKHHVEYLLNLLTAAGYSVSHIYGSLDQAARTFQMDQFRRGVTSILVVTDVAARGIDIPVLENVVNYDFPQGARVFVHRVGRTARAGRQGWAWSFVTNTELPYLLDLQLFLGRPLINDVNEQGEHVYTESLVLGNFQREKIDEDVEYIRSLDTAVHSLPVLREVMKRGHTMYERSKGQASPQSYKRAKEIIKDPKWLLAGSHSGIHPVLLRGPGADEKRQLEDTRKSLLNLVNSFSPSETVFEVTSKGGSENAALMKERRKALEKSNQRRIVNASILEQGPEDEGPIPTQNVEMADESDIVAVFGSGDAKRCFRDEDFYLSHYQKDANTEKGYSLTDGASSFIRQASKVAFDLTNDEGKAERSSNYQTWDKKKKKFIQGDGAGADNVKMVRTENGTRLPATFRSGRFDEWKNKSRVSLPRIGEVENLSSTNKASGPGGRRFKHHKIIEAKPLNKQNTDYDRKIRQLKKKSENAESSGSMASQHTSGNRLGGRRGSTGKTYGRVKTELKTAEQIRKDRKIMERRKAKNARPSKAGRKKGKGRH